MGVYFNFVLQTSIIFLIGVLVNFSTDGYFSDSNLDESVFWWIYCSILILLFSFNLFRYWRNQYYKQVVERFRTISLNRIIKTWQIFTLPVIVLLVSMIIIVVVKR